MSSRAVTNLLGWAGTVAVLLAYALVSTHVIGSGPRFQALNLAGALTLAAFYARQRIGPGLLLNLVWASIALAALLR